MLLCLHILDTIIILHCVINVGYICYDDGCHLTKYAQNPCRSHLTKTAKDMAEMSIVIDCMHMKGHTDLWCKKTCDPNLFPQLNNVCESVPLPKES